MEFVVMLKKQFLLLVFVMVLFAAPASARYIWQDYSLSLLHGSDYRVPYSATANQREARSVVTFEHVGATEFGDTFMFVDVLQNSKGKREIYGEISPRFSLGKLLKKDLSSGIIKDYFLSYTFEFCDGHFVTPTCYFRNHLYGFGIDFNIKPLSYFKIDYFIRENGRINHPFMGRNPYTNQQLTAVWGYNFTIGQEKFVYDGFVDYSTPETSGGVRYSAHTNFTSQLKWDISRILNNKNKLYVGVEYVHWTNKFGIKDTAAFRTNERNLNMLLRYHF